MAKLSNVFYPGDWDFHKDEDWEDYNKRVKKIYDSIDKDRIVKFPVADGYAEYYVVSFKPLVLQLIPIYDAYQIPSAHMRGLRLSDVNKNIDARKTMRKLFGD